MRRSLTIPAMKVRTSLSKRKGNMNAGKTQCWRYGCDQVRVAEVCESLKWIATVTFVLFLCFCGGCTATKSSVNDRRYRLSEHNHDRRGLQIEGSLQVQDAKALISLEEVLTLGNPSVSSTLLPTWKENATDPCTWEGVKCTSFSGVTRVTSLDLSNRTLQGEIPAQLFKLTALVLLSLNQNKFNGTIPSELGSLSFLTYLDLSSNTFNGKIPDSFFHLTNLQYLSMADNQLTGGIPETLPVMCGNLKILNISNNPDLGGQLHPGIHICKTLTTLDLELTNLQGYIPMELGQIPGLQFLNLGRNNLTGPIPDGLFSNCFSLSYIDLSLNYLTGKIPSAIGNCSALSVVMLSQNYLTSIPVELNQLTNLTWLFLGGNQFVGEIPPQITSLVNLDILELRGNNFGGSIPPALSQLKSIQYLMLENNNFSGSLPKEIAMLSNLIYLDVSDNPLGGAIPNYISSFTSMQFLFLPNNFYTGYIPHELGYLANLQVLDLGDNKLTGSIPNTIGNLRNLLWLRLANNRLTGQIPQEIGNCVSLIWLNLFNNSLSGPIPENVGSIGNMSAVTLSSNNKNLIDLPRQLGQCNIFLRWLPASEYPFDLYPALASLEFCSYWWNRVIKGHVIYPMCKYQASAVEMNGHMQLSMNMLSGSLPISLRETYNFNAIFLSYNNLSGGIPDIFNRPGLSFIRLHNNILTGAIPYDLSQMKCVEVLDLSFNNLNGSIPISLEHSSALTVFNVSYNPLLSGQIPTGGQFLTFPESSYLGDDLLCYSSVNNSTDTKIPLCKSPLTTQTPGQSHVHSSTSRTARLATLTIAGVLILIVIGFCYVGNRGFSKAASSLIVDLKESSCLGVTSVNVVLFSTELPKQLRYTDLLMATRNFDEGNIISNRGFAVVYKAVLMDGSLAVIKKLIQSQGLLSKGSFLAEIETIGHANQENLVPILACAVIESEKLLVYKYMVNGSLDDWLHEKPEHEEILDWPRRLKIAIGMARGLKFLHHNCSPPIIHGNMKSSNVLFDESFEPHLADFGLAEVLNGKEAPVSSIVVANVGYLPPEYGQTWRATIKGDVYSFGVVLLELLTGRRPVDVPYDDKNCRNIVQWKMSLRQDGREIDAYDIVVTQSGDPEELLKLLKLATWCTSKDFMKRPSMRDVLGALEDI